MDVTRKRLLYKATHRGTKETDKIIGGYAEAYLDTMTEDMLMSFDRLLDESDHALLNWIMDAEPVPVHVDANLLREIISFKDAL
ncbi:MAG: succinate dehydrogenase assembly factor 2 [Rhodospirillales bacterium]|nr:succinate dehydrogenase assembly factor 2 [Rhodospirillales bacterium]